jgi:uncharacterized protein (DUF2235 family)/acyl carrier protein
MDNATNRPTDDASDVTTNVQARVSQLVASNAGRDSVSLDTGLVTDLNLNAFDFSQLIEKCAEEFDIEIPDDETYFMKDVVETVAELAEVVDHKLYPTSRIPAILRKRRRRGPRFGKNIIICCDGTGNEYGRNNTNVVSAFQALTRDEDQIAFYDPGVGTFDALGKTFGKKVGKLLGAGFGYGLRENMQDAYSYLMDRFHPGDRIYLFGFSRGAFTVRSLAGLLHKCGLLQKGSKNLIPYALNIYNERGNDTIAEGFKDTYCHECKPYLIGVWDTVGSLGHILAKKFFNAELNPDVRFGYHAVSIDEKRKKFPVSLWDETQIHPNQTIEQVWFAGVHSDVGGWYDERGLSDTSLRWMLMKAEAAGLRLREGWETTVKLHPNAADEAAQHESRRGMWKLWRKVQREIPDEALIHKSVHERMRAIGRYKPPLPDNHKVVSEDDETK